jgi:prepilin-type N-terminal cleavage/methylation domain-containing protein
MRTATEKQGYTLVEIMIVVTIIGILATLALPLFESMGLRTRGTAFLNDGRVFSEAFIRYAQEHGEFPQNQDNRESFPPEMKDYIKEESWTRTTPLGRKVFVG